MLFDITPPIAPGLAVWPGDTAPRREVLMDMAAGDNLTLSTLRATVHLGAHADAPSHYSATGEAIADRPLERYLGRCEVVDVAARRGVRVDAAQLSRSPSESRVLLKTGTFPDPYAFNEDFAGLAPLLLETLHEAGVVLVGIDTPSVDLFDSKDLPSHQACLRSDMAILEGLVLEGVPEGVYELIALPLRLVGFDASPVRAVLRTLGRS